MPSILAATLQRITSLPAPTLEGIRCLFQTGIQNQCPSGDNRWVDFYCPNDKETHNEKTDELERITATGGHGIRSQQAGNEKESGNRCNLWRSGTEEKSSAEKEFNGYGTSRDLGSQQDKDEKQDSNRVGANATLTTAVIGSAYEQTPGADAGNSQHAGETNTAIEVTS